MGIWAHNFILTNSMLRWRSRWVVSRLRRLDTQVGFLEEGKHTFVLSHFSCVRLIATLWTVAHQAPLSLRILQARILEWVAMPSARGSFWPRDRPYVSSALTGSSSPPAPPGKPIDSVADHFDCIGMLFVWKVIVNKVGIDSGRQKALMARLNNLNFIL